jgi:pepF/M3 family oligoendopeptidase
LAKLKLNWDLESIFPGGSESKEYEAYLELLEKDIAEAYKSITAKANYNTREWIQMVNKVQGLTKRTRHATAFTGCLSAQNVKDSKAKLLGGKVRSLGAALASVLTYLDKHILDMPEEQWRLLLGCEDFADLRFNLEERRRRAKEKLSTEQETLVNDLSVDGYHAWSSLYDAVVARMTIPIEENGQTVQLSPGQAANKMVSPDRALREHVMERWEEAWSKDADYCALALNHLSGFRLNLYRHRGWDNVHREPLDINRMKSGTLETMWDTINKNKARLVTFLDRKKELLGVEKLSWHDMDAPLNFGKSESRMTYDEAAQFILEQFARFNPDMADFTRRAFENGWIEAEDRPGKRPGAFCTTFPDTKESRVFMTFSGTMNNVSTLAHELGHAYHQSVMNELPPFAMQYAMNVAETASTFAEVSVADAAIANSTNQDEKLSLIGAKLQRTATLLMNIHARFIFETNFYEERKKGLVSKERINELMVDAQKDAFAGTLGDYHPHFWASKLHFYITTTPFYNFPYTFGFLFATGVYARALKEGPSFAVKYDNLLRDTGRMMVEDLAMRHLGVDLTKPEFWQDAIDVSLAELDEFLALTAK